MVQVAKKIRQRLRIGIGALRAGAVNQVAHAFARVRYSMPDAHPRKLDLVLERDVVYGPTRGACHKLDVYTPTAPRSTTGPLPVVMYVHGGGFSMLSKETHRVMAFAIARRGYLVFNVNYRLGPRHRYPAPLEDVTEALLWVAANCQKYGGDPSRLALAGESAGGNLVTALGVMSSYRRPERVARRLFDANIPISAIIATYPFIDLTETDHHLASAKLPSWVKALVFDAASSYVGPDVARSSHAAPLTSPLLILESKDRPVRPLPPFFASCGTKDLLLPQSRRLKAALDELGTPCDLHVSPGEIHGFDAMVWRPAAREKWRVAHEFLARTLRGERTHAAGKDLKYAASHGKAGQ
jgi:acetyl esterase